MGHERPAELCRRWSVIAYGVLLLLGSACQALVEGDLAWSGYLEVAIPGSISLGVIFLGWSMVRDGVENRHVFAVFRWCVGGGLVMLFLTVWIVLPQLVENVPVYDPLFVGLTTLAVGSVVGGVIGTHEERLRRRSERLAEQNNRLDSFARIVAHDLRNPLHVAQGGLEVASETGSDADFERVQKALDRMELLIDEVLEISRGGSEELEVDRVSLPAVAERAWETVETGEARLDVRTRRALGADQHRLRVLFENLFRNAVEHGSTSPGSPPEGVRQDAVEHGSTSPRSHTHENAVEHGSTSPGTPPEGDRQDAVEHGSTSPHSLPSVAREDALGTSSDEPSLADAREDTDEHGGETVTVIVGDLETGFYVEDDGEGIDPELRERVFEGGYTTSPTGSGLGLSIVRSIADAHGWTHRISESSAGGARFEFTNVTVLDGT